MLDIRYSAKFKKDYKAITRRGYNQQLLQDVLTILCNKQPLSSACISIYACCQPAKPHSRLVICFFEKHLHPWNGAGFLLNFFDFLFLQMYS